MIYGKQPITRPIAPQVPGQVQKRQDLSKANGFAGILQDKINEQRDITISKHARLRMEMRNVNLTEAQRKKLADAVDKADAKGVRDTLVVMDKMAFVVNVRNRTVITAISSGELKENVFTNIDGAVFAD